MDHGDTVTTEILLPHLLVKGSPIFNDSVSIAAVI